MVYLGIEIGGTKLQLGAGRGDGTLLALCRRDIVASAGAPGIQQLIADGLGEISSRLNGMLVVAAGVGFGGPVDSATQRVIRSHQIEGWDDFALGEWVSGVVGVPAVIGNDADVAGLAEALHGAGSGHANVFYITVGSGIGGGLIINGSIYPGAGRGAAEIGHLAVTRCQDGICTTQILEAWASGWAIQRFAREQLRAGATSVLLKMAGDVDHVTGKHVALAAAAGDELAAAAIDRAVDALAQAICHVIALVCPTRIVIGGGVSFMGETLFFAPLRAAVERRVFKPFAGITQIVPASLGEEVVIHGAIALAKQNFPDASLARHSALC